MASPFELPPELSALGEFKSQLPDQTIGLIEETSFNPTEWTNGFFQNGTLLAAHFAKSVTPQIGWAADQLPNVIALADIALDLIEGRISTEDAIAATLQILQTGLDLAEVVLPDLVESISLAISEVVATAASVIPIVGVIIQVAIFVAKGIRKALQRVTPGAENGPIEWSWGRDDLQANRALDMLKTGDWTPLWLPPTGGWSAITISYDPWGKQSGWRFQPGGIFTDGRQGWLPGYMDGGVFYEGPAWGFDDEGPNLPSEKCLTQDKDCPQPSPTIVPLTTSIMLWPSAATVAAHAWSFLGKPTGAAGAVSFDVVEAAWDEWQVSGTMFLEAPVGPQSSAPQGADGNSPRIKGLHYMLRAALGYHGNLYPGGTLAAIYVKNELRAAREQFKRLLGTIACAYVPEDAPALKNGALAHRHFEMRQLLLKNDARFDVDLSLVTDADYRAALFDATAGGTLKAPYVPERRRPTIDGGPGPSLPRFPTGPGGLVGTGGSGGGGWLAALVLAAIAIFVFSRWGKK